jgi:hypothetical protein
MTAFLFIGACRDLESSSMPEVELKTSASTWGAWAGQIAGVQLLETFAFPLKVGSDWEMMNLANAQVPGGFDQQMDYSCQRGGYTYTHRVAFTGSDNFGDYSGFWNTDPANPYKAYVVLMFNNTPGVRWLKSQDPCPTTGAPTWIQNTIPFPGVSAVDYTYSFYDDYFNRMWITVGVALSAHPHLPTIDLIQLFADDTPYPTVLDNYSGPCTAINGHSLQFANGVTDSAGDVHVVFLDSSANNIKTIIFRPATNTWDCSTLTVVGGQMFQAVSPSCPCAGAGVAVNPGIGDGCLKMSTQPTIAIDKEQSPNWLNITYNSAMANNPGGTATLWYASANNGLPGSWAWEGYYGGGGAISVKPRVTAAYTPTLGGWGGVFGTISQVGVGGGQVAPVFWSSSNGGQTWSGMQAGDAWLPYSTWTGLCYWGEYNGATGDLANASGSTNLMYFNYEATPDSLDSSYGIKAFRDP